MLEFLDEKIRSLGTAACPPYHLASSSAARRRSSR
jgi:tartrate dehydratase alpha subunit/fumarate hydratase class I-like protein